MNLKNKKVRLIFFCMILMASMLVNVTGCSGKDENGNSSQLQDSESLDTQAESDSDNQFSMEQNNIIGEGSVKFLFTVVDKDGNETAFEVHTDKEFVGDALLETGLITGEESQYGLFVKTVNGITADYDTDGTYWAFYVNGEYASSGIDATKIEEGMVYMFKVEK